MFACGLGNDRSDEIVSQDVRPDFPSNQLWGLASHVVHLHCLFQRSQIQLGAPACPIADPKRRGHGVMSEVRERTRGRVRVGPGTLYSTIERMPQAGLLKEYDHRPDPRIDDERRRNCRLTAPGRKSAEAAVARLTDLPRTAPQKWLVNRSAFFDLITRRDDRFVAEPEREDFLGPLERS
jgi:DNA-binding PadR family transcriptional regulator